MLIKVKANLPDNKIGFIGDDGGLPCKRRYNGDEFRIPEELFSSKWMEKLEEKKKPGPKKKSDDFIQTEERI